MPKLTESSKIEIDLSSNWRLTTDDYNYIISRKVKRKDTGRTSFVVDGYYSKLEDAMESLLEKKLKEGEAKSLKALTKLIKDTKEEIKDYYKDIKKKK